ncbi:MAG: GAF domain-containing protein [Bacteroidia bacterium]|nr:GAF domain-containing protein [Bacteroidia bacterium]
MIQAGFFFEELMGGNNTIDFDKEVKPLLSSSQNLLQSAYDGASTEIGSFERASDEDLLALLKETLVDVEAFTESVNNRWELKRQGAYMTDSLGNIVSKAAIEADQQFQVDMQKVQRSIDRYIKYVDEDVSGSIAFLNGISWLSLVVFVGALAVLGIFLFRLQKGNDKLVDENRTRMDEQGQAVQSLSSFIEAISAGDYNVELTLNGDQNLSNALVKMRDKLRQNAQDDRRRNWSTAGLAEIGGILRSNNGSSAELYDRIIQFVVKYTDSNQGGLFVLSDESEEGDQHLELVSAYAFERKKFLTKKVNLGQGLVGQCFQEGQKIYLLEVPQTYVNITSGLGGTNPSALLLVPMKINDKYMAWWNSLPSSHTSRIRLS